MKSLTRLPSANSIRLSGVSRGCSSVVSSQRDVTTSAKQNTCVWSSRPRERCSGCNCSPICRREEPHIVVLGGGITGLSSAFHLARKFPTTKVTLIEGSSRVGGWLDSNRVDMGGGTVLLERGPRTLRSSSKPALELVRVHHLSRVR